MDDDDIDTNSDEMDTGGDIEGLKLNFIKEMKGAGYSEQLAVRALAFLGDPKDIDGGLCSYDIIWYIKSNNNLFQK